MKPHVEMSWDLLCPSPIVSAFTRARDLMTSRDAGRKTRYQARTRRRFSTTKRRPKHSSSSRSARRAASGSQPSIQRRPRRTGHLRHEQALRRLLLPRRGDDRRNGDGPSESHVGFERDILEAIVVQDEGHAVRHLVLISKPRGREAPRRLELACDHAHALTITVHELIPWKPASDHARGSSG